MIEWIAFISSRRISSVFKSLLCFEFGSESNSFHFFNGNLATHLFIEFSRKCARSETHIFGGFWKTSAMATTSEESCVRDRATKWGIHL